MKKILLSLSLVIAAAITIYSCQKESAEKTTVSNTTDPNLAVTSRDFSDCDACYETCNDCCLKLERKSGTGSVSFVFINPATGNVTTRVITNNSPGPLYVCAAGGYISLNPSNTSTVGKITVCSNGRNYECNRLKYGNLDVNDCFLSFPPCN